MSLTKNFDESYIVTFSCQDTVHVYEKGCGYLPAQPFKNHKSVEEAVEHLKERGVSEPKIIKPNTNIN